jgi:hypothetical protein
VGPIAPLFHHSGSVRVLVCGSRDWTDWEAIGAVLTDHPIFDRPEEDVTIIHGDARGADRLAANIAEGLGYRVVAFPADWKAEPRKAGILRNVVMLDERPDLVIAFQQNGSRGTQHTIDEARRRGIPVEVQT